MKDIIWTVWAITVKDGKAIIGTSKEFATKRLAMNYIESNKAPNSRINRFGQVFNYTPKN